MNSTVGRPRRLTDAQVKEILAWHQSRKTMGEVARGYGVSVGTIQEVIARRGVYKQPSPELRESVVEGRRAHRRRLEASGYI